MHSATILGPGCEPGSIFWETELPHCITSFRAGFPAALPGDSPPALPADFPGAFQEGFPGELLEDFPGAHQGDFPAAHQGDFPGGPGNCRLLVRKPA
jgi:hypothetical protein